MRTTLALAALTLMGGAVATTHAAVLQLDFGPTTVSGTDQSNSPLHAVTPTTGTTWNKVELADISSGLMYADGSNAIGVSLNLGRSTSSNTINFADQPGNSAALAGTVNTGIFAGTSVGRDGIFHGTQFQNNRLGLTLSGLPLGPYDVYIVAMNTSIGFDDNRRVQNVGALATASSTSTLDTTALPTLAIANHGTGLTASWSDGLNYRKLTVTLTSATPDLTIFSYGNTNVTGQEHPRGFLNAVQVVLIPEPTSLVMLGFAGLLLRRRRA